MEKSTVAIPTRLDFWPYCYTSFTRDVACSEPLQVTNMPVKTGPTKEHILKRKVSAAAHLDLGGVALFCRGVCLTPL